MVAVVRRLTSAEYVFFIHGIKHLCIADSYSDKLSSVEPDFSIRNTAFPVRSTASIQTSIQTDKQE